MFLNGFGVQRIQTYSKERLRVLAVDAAGAGVAGATVLLSIRRDDTGFWWNGTGWQTAYVTNTMLAQDAVNRPGEYYFDLTGQEEDMTLSLKATTAAAAVVNDPWSAELVVGSWQGKLDAAISSRAGITAIAELLYRIPTNTGVDVKLIRNTVREILAKVGSLK